MDISNFIYGPSCVLYLPLWKKDCATGQTLYSDDAYGHQCTVTGAKWGKQGRYFDGGNQYIVIPDNLAFRWVDLSLFLWVRTTQVPASAILFTKDAAANRGEFYFDLIVSGKSRIVFPNMPSTVGLTSNTAINDGSWRFCGVTYKARTAGTSEVTMYRDGLPDGSISNEGYPIQTKTNSVYIGIYNDLSSDYLGDIGEVFAFTRTLNPVESRNLYLATKWRYQ